MTGKDERGARGLSLAARLRASIDDAVQTRRQAALAEERRRERLQRERVSLLHDLAAFGHALGHADVTATEVLVVVRLADRELRFEADGDDGEVAVRGEGLSEGWRLRRNEELGRWGLHPPVGPARILFDAGLEELVRRAFGLRPAAGASGAEEEAPPPSSEARGKRTL